MEPLPMVLSCSLDEVGIRTQLARYRRAGRDARVVEIAPERLVVELQADVDRQFVEEAIAVERECCPFFTFAWEPASGRLEVSVPDVEHAPALDAIGFALGLDDRDAQGATPRPQ